MGAINERLFKLLEAHDENQKELALYLGIDESTLSSWKRRGTDPPAEMIIKIAEYFNVSERSLIEGDLKISDIVDMRYAKKVHGKYSTLSKEEIEFCMKYRNLSDKHKAMINSIIEIAYSNRFNDI